ncbi:MAG: helix-turn-helix domain-containing protein [Prevotella sp.]|nr:helix-turn-helix domain-containing protein [Prevotella sp.]
MANKTLTFNDLPQVVAELRDEVIGMKVALQGLQKGQNMQKMERMRRTMNVEEAADYLRMPLNTLHMKLQKGEIPGSKPGKRWVFYSDELDKYLEVKRRNAVPMTSEEQNEAILASHRRKPTKNSWQHV